MVSDAWQLMDRLEVLSTFAETFVTPELRDRFVHEAIKKAEKLHYRICHRMDGLFPEQYRNASVQYEESDHCLLLSSKTAALVETTWGEAAKELGMGGGVLIIDGSGKKFLAEGEGCPKVEFWAGLR